MRTGAGRRRPAHGQGGSPVHPTRPGPPDLRQRARAAGGGGRHAAAAAWVAVTVPGVGGTCTGDALPGRGRGGAHGRQARRSSPREGRRGHPRCRRGPGHASATSMCGGGARGGGGYAACAGAGAGGVAWEPPEARPRSTRHARSVRARVPACGSSVAAEKRALDGPGRAGAARREGTRGGGLVCAGHTRSPSPSPSASCQRPPSCR